MGGTSADSTTTVFDTNSVLAVSVHLALSAYFLYSFSPARLLLELALRSLSLLGSRPDPRGGYSSKDLGALYYEEERHQREKVQQASVLMLVEEGYYHGHEYYVSVQIFGIRRYYLGLGSIL